MTGENVCELHLHGGPAIITMLMDALSSFEGLKYAEPGEFSRRYLKGVDRFDLKKDFFILIKKERS